MTVDVVAVTPPAAPFVITPAIPGSKSITNRALLCAALAEGPTTIDGALVSEDSEAMLDCIRRLGLDAVGVKARSNEGLDAIGAKQAIAAQVVVLIER